MIKQKIYILSAAINEGKTTALQNWIKNRNDVFGILTPVIHGKRYFYDITTAEKFEMEASETELEILEIGRFKFSQAAFTKASAIFKKAFLEKRGWLIIDEVGPLELKQKGFHDVLSEIFTKDEIQLKIILVIRKTLLQEVIQHYSLSSNEIILLDLNAAFFHAV